MVFGAIGIGFKSTLIRCSKGVDCVEYVGMVLSCRQPEGPNAMYEGEDWAFPQDGGRCHTAERTMSTLQKFNHVLENFIWPATSPDLNSIEMLWAVIAWKLVTANVRTDDEMFAEVQRVWNWT
jgi:hypothetical protein